MVDEWWNDNAPPPSHTPHEAILRLPVRQLLRASALVFGFVVSSGLRAQTTTPLLPDATVLPTRALRLRLLTAWTRYDEQFGAGATPRNIASTLASDSLGIVQIPAFSPIQSAIQDASGLASFRLTAGQIGAVANSRIVTAPLIAEFGVSSRITLGVVIPFVETRTSLVAGLNQQLGHANVGPNPALGGQGSALGTNTTFVQSVLLAADTLRRRLSDCQATPTAGSCASLLAQQASAQGLVQTSQAFAAAIARLYGTSAGSTPGQPFIPLDSSQGQLAIAARIQALRDQYRALLGRDPIAASVAGAHGPAALAQLQSLLTAMGRDTLQSTDRSSVGDITLGAVFQIANTFGDTTPAGLRAHHYRLAANGAFRFGTGQPANRNRYLDVGTGYGQPGIEAGVAADMQLSSHWSGSGIASYTAQLGSLPIGRIPNPGNAVYPLAIASSGTYTAGNVLSLSAIPRYRVSGYFALTGRYSFVHIAGDAFTAAGGPGSAGANAPSFGGAASTAQQIGVGFTYATVAGSARGPGALPFEVAFSHLETIAASGGPTPKAFREQLELRLYLGR